MFLLNKLSESESESESISLQCASDRDSLLFACLVVFVYQ